MQNNLMVIKEQEVLGKQFKVYGTVEEPLFMAKDVAEWIEHSNPTMMIESVDDDEKEVKRTKDSLGRENSATFLTENGLYEVLFQSRKPIAKEFKKEVKTILKTLRQTGGYINNSDKFVDMYFDEMPEEQKNVMRGLLNSIEEKQKKIKTLQSENSLLAQKNLEWADRPLINALVRAYGYSIGGDYKTAWRDFKKELLYRHSINLNARKTVHLNNGGGKNKKTLDFIHDDEIQQAISTAVSLCMDNNVDISDIIDKKAS